MGGMVANTGNGVVMTMSQNTPLFTKAVEAAKSGKGLSEDEGIKGVQAHLPANRVFEMYLGTKSIMDTINSAMAMFGGGAEIKVPAKISPVGMAASMEAGGVDIRLFVPIDVIKSVAEAVEAAKAGGEEPDEAPAKSDTKPPRF